MKASSKPTTAKKTRILIVEDDTGIREMLAMVLQDAGYEVDQAEHAFSAICSVVRAMPDLILADIRMPIVDGMGLATELKTHLDTRDIPVVAIFLHDVQRAKKGNSIFGIASTFKTNHFICYSLVLSKLDGV